jgi:hypothetical protein
VTVKSSRSPLESIKHRRFRDRIFLPSRTTIGPHERAPDLIELAVDEREAPSPSSGRKLASAELVVFAAIRGGLAEFGTRYVLNGISDQMLEPDLEASGVLSAGD